MRPRRLAILMAALALAGCATARPKELLALCREHNGLKIYRAAENVEGVIFAAEEGCGGDCKNFLSHRTYRFVESQADRGSFDGLIAEAGVYRFALAPMGHPDCWPFEMWHASRYPEVSSKGRHIERYEGVCIATTPIEQLTAIYEVHDEGVVRRPRSYGTLATSSERVVDRRDGSLLAEYRTHWVNVPKQLGAAINCPVDKPFWSLSDVLKPPERQ